MEYEVRENVQYSISMFNYGKANIKKGISNKEQGIINNRQA